MNPNNTTLCPNDDLLDEYRNEVIAKQALVDDMTPDQVWVDFHIRECDSCKNLVLRI
jgi:hypothetical protein